MIDVSVPRKIWRRVSFRVSVGSSGVSMVVEDWIDNSGSLKRNLKESSHWVVPVSKPSRVSRSAVFFFRSWCMSVSSLYVSDE